MNARKLRLESLEERTLLAVTAGGFQQAAAFPEPAGATGWIVNTLDDATTWDTADDVISLREAIGRAQTGDTITFDDSLSGGTITLCGSQLNVYQGITIDAASIGGITIDAAGQSRVFYVRGGSAENPVELISLTIRGGNTTNGGGIYNRDGNLTLTDLTVSMNSANSYGGGIWNNSTLNLINTTVWGNTANDGSGIYSYGTLTVMNSAISGNTANSNGGGVFNYNGTLTIMNSTISGNSASSNGGGVLNYNGTLTLTDLTVSGNTANYGGGIYNKGTVTLINSNISGNTANSTNGNGGGIYNNYGTLTVTNSTVSGNTASYCGGGIYDFNGTLVVTNTIVSLNYAKYYSDITTTSYSGSNNLIGLDPGFVVAPVFKNGKLINADELDLSLTSESIAIDRGTNEVVETEADIAGNPRIFAAWHETPTVDIGAYEYQEHVVRSTVVTTALDIVDESDGLVSLREAIFSAKRGGTITFDATLMGETIILNGTQLEVHEKITIDATSIGGITIDAYDQSRVFYIEDGDKMNPVQLIGLTITGGRTEENGGGIYIRSGVVMITNSTVWGNTANSNGGGIFNNNGTLTVTNSTVLGNTANSNGGGIFNNNGTLTVTNSTILGNTANSNGGGIYNNYYVTLPVTNSTISGNTANVGGGIYNINGMLAVTNTIVSLNYARDTTDLYSSRSYSSSHSLIGLDPSFAVAPVFKNGKLINADELDLSLTSESIAIDRGTNEVVETEADIAGNPRIFAAWHETPTVDIGAYEYQEHVVRSTVVTTALDIVDESDGLVSLREAIFSAALGETITFDASLAGETIILNGTQLEIHEKITIDATSIGGITIDANNRSRVFYIEDGDEMDPVQLICLTITGGRTEENGGGICNNYGTLTLTNSTILGNTANDGGGIYNDGTLMLMNSAISMNTANNDGGGIYNDNGTLTLTNSTILGNSAINSSGGGIYNHNKGTVTLTNSIISGNTVSYSGGGIYSSNSGTLILTESTVLGNTSSRYGGGIYNSGKLTVTGSTISENSARYYDGGGIYNNGKLTVTNSVISKNSTKYDEGGGIYNKGTLTLTNSTISGNMANNNGGGIYNNEGTLTLTNTILAFNEADGITDLYSDCSYSASHNIIGFDPGFTVAPVFENGKLVNADELDFSLTEGSIAIDAGQNSAVTTETDISGNPRIVNWFVDIGAYEYQSGSEPEVPSTVVTTSLDILNGADGLISLREAILYAAAGDTVTFDDSLVGETITLSGTQLEIDKGITIDATSIDGITIDADGKSRVFYINMNKATNPIVLIDLTITGGRTSDQGGGIYNSGALTITNSTLTGNTSSGDGGGIYNIDATLALISSTISENTAGNNGGGICSYNSTLTVTGSTISGNTAKFAGGIRDNGTLIVTNSTISGNTADYGGGIYNSTGMVTLTNTIVSLNYAKYYSDITTASYSGSNNLIGLDPGFVVAPVFENGKLVNADGLDFSLTAWSIAIDAGLNSAVMTETDIAGNPRIVAAWRDPATVDVGAYEYQECVERSTVVTTVLDIVDGADGLISLREAILYAAAGDTVTFDDSLAGGTITLNGTQLEIGKGITIDATSIGGITIDADGKSRVIYNDGGNETNSVKLICLTVTGGSTSDQGGGIYNSGVLTITNSVFAGNTASGNGGGIYNVDGALALICSTISGNTANSSGGGIYNTTGTVTLTNSILSLNYAMNDSDINTSYFGSNNVVSFDPGFIVAPVFVNGKLVDADELDLSLAERSIAIDAGLNSAVTTEIDIVGNPRIINAIVDIGAYEYQGGDGRTEQLATPSITTGSQGVYVSYGTNCHLIQWTTVENASGYELSYIIGDEDRFTNVEVTGTDAVVTGLTYGQNVQYRVRALGTGSYTDSEWSSIKTFNVCPMDINGDGDISGGDRTLLANSWLAEEGDVDYQYYADINGDSDISNGDRAFLSGNWLGEAGNDDLTYPTPRPRAAADAVFAEFASADLGADLNMF